MTALKFALPAFAALALMGCSSDDPQYPEPEHPIMPAPESPIEPDKDNPIEAVPGHPIEDVEGDWVAPDLAMLGPALMIPSADGTEFVLRFVDGQHVREEAFVTELLPTNLNQAPQEASIRYLTKEGDAIDWERLMRAQWGVIAEYTVNSQFGGTWLRAQPERELILPGEVVADRQMLAFEHLGAQDYSVEASIKGISGAGNIASPDCHLMGQLHRRVNDAGYIGELVGASCVNHNEQTDVQGYIVARTIDGEVSIQLHAELHRSGKPVIYYGGDF